MKRPIVFLDTETVGLDIDDPIWEIAAIRREVDGTETTHHWHLLDGDQRITPPRSLPEPFRSDFEARYGVEVEPIGSWFPPQDLRDLFADQPTIVGAVPNFDTERIEYQLGVHGWHHRLRCVETLTAGHLRRDIGGLADCATALGLPVANAHTAMGDVLMVRAIWDHIMTEEQQA